MTRLTAKFLIIVGVLLATACLLGLVVGAFKNADVGAAVALGLGYLVVLGAIMTVACHTIVQRLGDVPGVLSLIAGLFGAILGMVLGQGLLMGLVGAVAAMALTAGLSYLTLRLFDRIDDSYDVRRRP
jgi:hypothetical protein